MIRSSAVFWVYQDFLWTPIYTLNKASGNGARQVNYKCLVKREERGVRLRLCVLAPQEESWGLRDKWVRCHGGFSCVARQVVQVIKNIRIGSSRPLLEGVLDFGNIKDPWPYE